MIMIVLFVYFVFPQNIYSLTILSPIEILELPIPSFPNESMSVLPHRMYSLQCNNNYLNMTFLNVEEWFTGAFGDMEFYVSDHCIIQYDLLTKTFSTIETGTGTVQFDRLEIHSDTVLVEGKTLLLEDSYQPNTFYEDYTYDGEGISTAILSKNKKWIGCMVLYYWGTQDGHYNNSGLSSGIWSAINGSKILRAGFSFPSQIDPAFLEISFSDNDHYLFSRIVAAVNETGHLFDTYLTPLLSLVNIVEQKRWDAEYDVDFSSDGRYLVTYTKGYPSLIDIERNQVIRQYKIPTHLFAICMSQDMRYVYIACNDNKIYVFDSGVDSGCEEWELLE